MVQFLNRKYIVAMYQLGNKVLSVHGLPGGGKTRTVLGIISDLYSRLRCKVVISLPLKTLRDWVGEYYLPSRGIECEIVKSKEELCSRVRENVRDESNILTYMYRTVKTCLECGEKNCDFKQSIKNFFSSSRGIFVMTHTLMYLLYLMSPSSFKNVLVVIDEADSMVDLYQLVCTRSQLEEIARLAVRDRVWREVVKRIRKSCIAFGNLYFMKPEVPRGRLIVLVSATLTPEIVENLGIPESYTVYYSAVRSRIVDVFVLYPRFLSSIDDIESIHPKYVSPGKWIPELADAVTKLVDMGMSIGIASRSYRVSDMLCRELELRGIEPVCDLYSDHPPGRNENVRVIIWTTRGKWFRGVSLPDTDVIICLYQYPTITKPRYVTYELTDIDMVEALSFTSIINDAVNVQSYYRSNRRRDMVHRMVFLDSRSWRAMINILRHYAHLTHGEWWHRLRNPVKVDNITKLVEHLAQ